MGRIRYMGNKLEIAPDVVRLVGPLQPGAPLLDLFCGMCSIGSAFASTGRPVWGNDVQEYAALAARCQLTSRLQPLRSPELARRLASPFRLNFANLKERFDKQLKDEVDILGGDDHEAFAHAHDEWRHAANDAAVAAEVAALHEAPASPSRLFALSFAWGYFGVQQSITIDSIRYAIDEGRASGVLADDEADWALLALAEAASVCASAPGHFAQYLRGRTAASYERVRRQRRRDVWNEFLVAADRQDGFGSAQWRAANATFTGDALTLWNKLDGLKTSGAIVYADPP